MEKHNHSTNGRNKMSSSEPETAIGYVINTINALQETGLSTRAIARYIDRPASTVRGWALGNGSPKSFSFCEMNALSEMMLARESLISGEVARIIVTHMLPKTAIAYVVAMVRDHLRRKEREEAYGVLINSFPTASREEIQTLREAIEIVAVLNHKNNKEVEDLFGAIEDMGVDTHYNPFHIQGFALGDR
jgi:hypothetical protein